MTPAALFKAANTLALLSWLVLILFGRKRAVSSLVTAVIIPSVLAVFYIVLLFTHFGDTQGSFNTLEGVAGLFSNRWMLLAGWVHYLAFDLFVGSWQVRDAMRQGISHVLVIPCLVLTFLFGPAGLLLYLCLRFVLRRSFVIDKED